MIYHSESLVLVRKGRAFYETLYQGCFFEIQGGGMSLTMTANWCDTNEENVQDNQYTQRTNAQKEDITTLRVTTKIDQGSALEEFKTLCNKEVKFSEKVQWHQKELENPQKREETWQLNLLNLQVQKITGYEASF